MYFNSILLPFLQWRWESNFAFREIVSTSSWKGRSSLALLFFLLCLLRAGFTITRKAEAGSCRLPGSREGLCLAGRPGGPVQGQRWLFLSSKTAREGVGTEAVLCSPSQRLLHRVWPGLCAEQEPRIREMPRGFSLGLSLLSVRSPTVQAVDRHSQTGLLSFCFF